MPTSYPLSLQTLLSGIEYIIVNGETDSSIGDIIINSVTSDSREVHAGSLFVAVKGAECDGHDFISRAVANGCVTIICQRGKNYSHQLGNWNGTVIEVEDSGRAYALVAANFYNNPAEELIIIGITGTNGKTTVTFLLEQVLRQANIKVGVIGTVNNRYVGNSGKQVVIPTRLTTPGALELQQLLRKMVDEGVQYLIMEVSSHALMQNRISDISFSVAAFTNLSRDHLDYHVDMKAYFSAKLKLFTEHMAIDGIAVLPADFKEKEEFSWRSPLMEQCRTFCKKTLFWGQKEGADIRLLDFDSGLNETRLQLEVGGKQIEFCSSLVGRFNIDNMLTVFALSSALEIDMNNVVAGLEKAVGAPGRLERVVGFTSEPLPGPVVFIDYAHTPDALAQVLSTVASLPHNDLYCIFGCGGDRDNGKRPVMGEIAARLSDVAIATDDNPRTEDPDLIIDQILGGMDMNGSKRKSPEWLKERNRGEKGIIVERDRKKAIELAITSAAPEDIVLIAGKGHETYQLSIKGRRFFDDSLEAKNVFCSWTDTRVLKSVQGKPAGGDIKIRLLGEVSTDSRIRGRDSIFIALKGEKYDGHDFASRAVENGSCCLVVEKEIRLPENTNVSQIIVTDTLKALGDMAAYRRKQLAKICDQIVIGITGSCGKTTVKEMVAAILKRKWPEGAEYSPDSVLKTQGNFNNLIGLPLSLLPLNLTHRAAVLEMGMNQPGELSRLTEIADPDISCIVNIHSAHLEGLQSIEGVAMAKDELFAGTKENGLLVVNLDDSRVSRLAEKYNQNKITFAVHEENLKKDPDIWATDINLEETGVITFTLHSDDKTEDIHLYAAGEHNVSNALAAAAITFSCGADIGEIAAGLADFRPPDKRMEILQAKGGYSLLNDTYNANPASMAAGLKTLKHMSRNYCVAILGDMLELGATAGSAHFELGQLVAGLQINSIGLVGEFKDEIRNGALAGGLSSENIKLFKDKKNVAEWVRGLISQKKLGQDGHLLVKASRGLRFETIVSELVD